MRLVALILGLFIFNIAHAQPYLFLGSAFTAGGEQQSEAFAMPGIGYRMSPAWSVEGAYFDARIDTSSSTSPGAAQLLVTHRRHDLEGASLALVGRTSLAPHLALTGQATLYRLRGDLHESDTLYAFGPPATSSAQGERRASGSGTTIGLGVGLALEVSRAIEVRARLDWIRGRSGIFGAGHDLEDARLVGLSAAYRF